MKTPTNRINHFIVGDPRRECSPRPQGNGVASSLSELATSACGCRAAWHLSEYADGGATPACVRFGWWLSVAHVQACKKANA